MKYISKALFGSGASKNAKPLLDSVRTARKTVVDKTLPKPGASMVVVKPGRNKLKVQTLSPQISKEQTQRLELLQQKIMGELGAFDGGLMSEWLNEHKAALLEALYESGVNDKAKLRKVGAVFVAGSGNTLTQAIEKSVNLPRNGPSTGRRAVVAVAGDGWLDNVHQLLGTGVGGTQGQRNVAYFSGALKGRKVPVTAHSQGNLTMENTARTLESNHPEIRQLTVHGIGSPLVKNFGPNSMRTTGWFDPIQLVRGAASLFFGQVIPDAQKRVGGGHGADGYIKRIRAAQGPAKKD